MGCLPVLAGSGRGPRLLLCLVTMVGVASLRSNRGALSQTRIRRTLTTLLCSLLCSLLLSSALVSPLQAGSEVDRSEAYFDRTGELGSLPFRTLTDLQTRMKAITTVAQADVFWREITSLGQMPLVFGDTAVFFYRGPATTVEWIGDFTIWQAGEPLV